VLDEDDRDAVIANSPNHLECLLDLDLVESGHDLVEEQEPWAHGERPSDLERLRSGTVNRSTG